MVNYSDFLLIRSLKLYDVDKHQIKKVRKHKVYGRFV